MARARNCPCAAREPRGGLPRHTCMTTSHPTSRPTAAPRTRRRGPLLAAGSVLAVGGVFGAGVLVGQHDAPPSPAPPHSASPASDPFRLANADLAPVDSCEELLASYQERALEVVGPWGWEGGWHHPLLRSPIAELAGPQATAGRADAAAPTPRAATSSATGTNVQEEGVDEPDTVKTDGSLLLRVRDGDLVIHDVTGTAPRELSRTVLPEMEQPEVLLVGDTVVALGTTSPPDSLRDEVDTPATRVVTLDVSDPVAPEVVSETVYDATLVTARQHGDVVRVVVRNDLPDLDFRHPDDDRDARTAQRHNEDQVRASTLADWLPSFVDEADGEAEQAVACADVAVPGATSPLGTLTTVTFHADDARERTTVAVAAATDVAYFSPDRLHLATAPMMSGWGWRRPSDGRFAPDPDEGRSHLYSFALEGTDTAFVASGRVDGSVRDRWSMDSVDGVLRVAVGATTATGNFNSVVTFAEDDGRLVERGRVDRLGVNEEIKAVRWFDDLAFVVTFRQVDPLYAVDLSDPTDPTLLGELKIPGFSEYLHPVGPHRLIGIGQDASRSGALRGAQAALFLVTDLARPRRLDTVTYPEGTQAGAGTDPRQFTWLPERRTALTVVTDGWVGRTAWVSALRLAGGRLHETRTEVAHGHDVGDVRLVPLPSGDVVLVAGDSVEFFDVD
ncbi:beta-propeller domain-containing protein [Nocardioides sp. Y6]|uniref:Beta-propeller domain-containing protein n=1 Tax=Nocardioides malaquae TaxID=2773426 RepID=A0ABR9RUU8_9ACTN|nr:beta-propeller domain-containing protein [Nocardioides malaquae]MBE7325361.1 beta-propeller domain-containing protein [Nocardioides malaquae]